MFIQEQLASLQRCVELDSPTAWAWMHTWQSKSGRQSCGLTSLRQLVLSSFGRSYSPTAQTCCSCSPWSSMRDELQSQAHTQGTWARPQTIAICSVPRRYLPFRGQCQASGRYKEVVLPRRWNFCPVYNKWHFVHPWEPSKVLYVGHFFSHNTCNPLLTRMKACGRRTTYPVSLLKFAIDSCYQSMSSTSLWSLCRCSRMTCALHYVDLHQPCSNWQQPRGKKLRPFMREHFRIVKVQGPTAILESSPSQCTPWSAADKAQRLGPESW